jgi:hypothetical protein
MRERRSVVSRRRASRSESWYFWWVKSSFLLRYKQLVPGGGGEGDGVLRIANDGVGSRGSGEQGRWTYFSSTDNSRAPTPLSLNISSRAEENSRASTLLWVSLGLACSRFSAIRLRASFLRPFWALRIHCDVVWLYIIKGVDAVVL